MFGNPSLMTRIVIGKSIGFLVGLIALFILPYIVADATWMMRLGFLFWYTTVGAMIGVFGVFTWHPILKLPLPWWVRSTGVGAWMNFVLVLFAYDDLRRVFQGMSLESLSPFWFVLEGAVIGYVIGYFATRFGGEGKSTVEEAPVPGG